MSRAMTVAAACLALAACGGGDNDKDGATAAGNGASPPATAAAGKDDAAASKANLLDRLTSMPSHATLANAVKAAGLTETLSGAQPYTLFAPSDAAFQKLPAGSANELLAPESKGRLTALLTGHIVPGVVTSEDLGRAIDRGKGKAQLATVGGSTLTFTRSGDAILVAGPNGQARVEGASQTSSNGAIYSLDGVLMP